jgi:hypothetical protein
MDVNRVLDMLDEAAEMTDLNKMTRRSMRAVAWAKELRVQHEDGPAVPLTDGQSETRLIESTYTRVMLNESMDNETRCEQMAAAISAIALGIRGQRGPASW